MKKNKLSRGQISLVGDIYDLDLKYKPHRAISREGSVVIVLRLPSEATELERIHSHTEAKRLAESIRTPQEKKSYRYGYKQ